jgi:hypothetical protein
VSQPRCLMKKTTSARVVSYSYSSNSEILSILISFLNNNKHTSMNY